MNLIETFLTALRDLRQHKFRSALATLGVIFGVASVEAMISISEGAREQTLARIAVLGVDNIIAKSVKPTRQDAGPQQQGQPQQGNQQRVAQYGLKRKDLEYVRNAFPYVRYAIGMRNPRLEVYSAGGRSRSDVAVLATEPDYIKVTRSHMVKGRFLNPLDDQARSMVCVVGAKAAAKLFAFNEPIGSTLRIGPDWYTVVGIMANEADVKDAGGDDVGNIVYIPLATSRTHHGDFSTRAEAGSREMLVIELDQIAIQMEDEHDALPTAQRLTNYLSGQHKAKDWDVMVPLELMNQKAATQRIFTIVMASIASISLLIGGIGIMNIMLANVSDRRKEIGTRRALGARQIDIVRQFLLEAATLTTLGGVAGIAVGYGLARSISSWADWPTIITPSSIALSLSVSCLSGLIFGFWPAHSAAKVNPIEALRSG